MDSKCCHTILSLWIRGVLAFYLTLYCRASIYYNDAIARCKEVCWELLTNPSYQDLLLELWTKKSPLRRASVSLFFVLFCHRGKCKLRLLLFCQHDSEVVRKL